MLQGQTEEWISVKFLFYVIILLGLLIMPFNFRAYCLTIMTVLEVLLECCKHFLLNIGIDVCTLFSTIPITSLFLLIYKGLIQKMHNYRLNIRNIMEYIWLQNTTWKLFPKSSNPTIPESIKWSRNSHDLCTTGFVVKLNSAKKVSLVKCQLFFNMCFQNN